MMMKHILNKWQFGIRAGWFEWAIQSFAPWICFWFLNLRSFPEEGGMLRRCHYRGFYKMIQFRPIITLQMWRVLGHRLTLPIRLRFR